MQKRCRTTGLAVWLVLGAALALPGCDGTTGPGNEGLGSNRNWAGNYLRSRLSPRQGPMLGEYSSRDPAVISQHVDWALASGIDFFAIPWRGPASWGARTLADHLVLNGDFQALEWCLVYELPTILTGLEDPPAVNLTLAARDTILSHLLYFHDAYFGMPNYLHIEGRPVVFLRKSRLIAGANARQQILALRQDFSDATGYGLYLVGDEVVWGAIALPDGNRIAAFDAMTGIDLGLLTSHNGYPAGNSFHTDLDALWTEYAQAGAAVEPVTPLYPMVWPGFNDRAWSPVTHPVIARAASAKTQLEGSTYSRMWLSAAPYEDNGVVLLNSFNDWRRDTQVEPVADNGDATGSLIPSALTAGTRYFPYGDFFLEQTDTDKGNVLLGALYEVWYDSVPPGM